MCTHYVLIDYENIQPSSLEKFNENHFHIVVFVGAGQTKLPLELAAAMQKRGPRAEYIKIAGHGANALDFHLAYYIGRLVSQDPTGCFHIISKDTGFDPLLEHLKSRSIQVSRCTNLDEILSSKVADTQSDSEVIDVVVANLQMRGASRPRTLQSLRNTIHALFQKRFSGEKLLALLNALQARGFIQVQESRVLYRLPM